VTVRASTSASVAGTVSEDIPNVLGRPATSIDAWIEENRSAFVG
jgi:hypothetical protein